MVHETYKAIIFDFFGVISSEVAPKWLERYFGQTNVSILKEQYFTPLDRGVSLLPDVLNQLSAITGIPSQIIYGEWEQLIDINASVVSLITFYKHDFKIGLLSDASSDFLRDVIHEHNLEQLFDAICISSETKYLKRDYQAFQIICEQLKVAPHEAIFIDDNAQNILVAKQYGLQTIQYSRGTDLNGRIKSILSS